MTKKSKPKRKGTPRRPKLLAGNSEGVKTLIEIAGGYPVRVCMSKSKKKWTVRDRDHLQLLCPVLDEYCEAGHQFCVESIRCCKRRR